ncbi:hypothetical protein ANANG_G00219860 [Anguilla anguilla]|uniref:Sema domain-containing protein n=1 Tax=Anguilla anguilla TaxID=7936 RepID=A0A9D3LW38_ANGAN|nr:hypothetical protein ANANG_G00219860 [Anguilla anguilla]
MCAGLPMNTLEAYPCGSDHTPSPMASRVPMEAEVLLDSPSARLTAVAVSMRAGHAIAFLGDSKGNLHKVFLGPDGKTKQYATIPIQPDVPINGDLLLDHTQENLYVMTSTKVEKRPVAECSQHMDCGSCLSTRDPYCGWCVLEGRCVQSSECAGAELAGQWLWSFDAAQQCLSVQSLRPSNISREEKRDVFLSVPGLPRMENGGAYTCVFGEHESPAIVMDTRVTCSSPDTVNIPPIHPGEDHVKTTLSLRFREVTVAAHEFTFYDCRAVQELSQSAPCRGCVSSRWGCNWCVQQHACSHKDTCERGVVIYNEHPRDAPVHGGTYDRHDDDCPSRSARSRARRPHSAPDRTHHPEATAQLPVPLSTMAAPTSPPVTTPSRPVAPPSGDDNSTRVQTEVSDPEPNPPETAGEAEGGEGAEESRSHPAPPWPRPP